MEEKNLKLLSKHMSWVLRHAADQIELPVDPEGYVPIGDLTTRLRVNLPWVTEEHIHRVVKTIEPQKQRFTIDGTWIRANYGHSFEKVIEHKASEPPAILYHGTSENKLDEILNSGLLPMSRQYVHLTTELSLARKIGGRHGKPSVLQIDTQKAKQAGIMFLQANPMFWLVDHIPSDCLTTLW